MKKVIISALYLFLVLLVSCSPNYLQQAQERYGEVYTALGYDTAFNGIFSKRKLDKFRAVGVDRFHTGEGIIVVHPKYQELVYFQIKNINGNVVYSYNFDSNDNFLMYFFIKNMNLAMGEYEALADFRETGRIVRKKFWILENSPNTIVSRQNNYVSSSEIISAIAWHDINRDNIIDTNNELIKKGEINFKKSEGFFVVYPNGVSQEMEIEIFKQENQKKVYEQMLFVDKAAVMRLDLPVINLGKGSYKIRVLLRDSKNLYEKLFWIVD